MNVEYRERLKIISSGDDEDFNVTGDVLVARFREASLKDIEKDPAHKLILHGHQLRSKGEIAKAVTIYTRATLIDRGSTHALISRGIAYAMLKKRDMAMADFSKCFQLDPKCDAAYFNMALMHYQRGKLHMSCAYLDRAIELRPRDPVLYETRGLIRRRMRNYHGAKDDYQKRKIILKGKRYASIHIESAEDEEKVGRGKEGEDGVERSNNGDVFYNVHASIFCKAGEEEIALKTRPDLRSQDQCERILKMLRQFDFFRRLNDDELMKIACVAGILKVDTGSTIVEENEQADMFYVLWTGQASVRVSMRGGVVSLGNRSRVAKAMKENDETTDKLNGMKAASPVQFESAGSRAKTTVGKITAGESFGELALISNSRRSASIVADVPCALITISKIAFFKTGMDKYMNRVLKHRAEIIRSIPLFDTLSDTTLCSWPRLKRKSLSPTRWCSFREQSRRIWHNRSGLLRVVQYSDAEASLRRRSSTCERLDRHEMLYTYDRSQRGV